MFMAAARRSPIGADGGGGGGFLAPSFGTTTTFADSTVAGGFREFTFSHTHTAGSSPGLLLCVAMKGETDVGPPTFTLDKVAYNGVSIAANEFGRSSSNLFAGQPTVLAFYLASPATGANDVEFDVTPSSSNIQCIAMAAIDIANFGGIGSGVDQDGSNTAATSQSISVTSGQDNSRIFGITAAQGNANGGSITTPAGYFEHANFGTDFSSSTDIGFAVHSIIKPTAGAQAYATSWSNSAKFGSLTFEMEGVAA